MKIKLKCNFNNIIMGIILIFIFFLNGCIGENNNGKIKVNVLDEYKKDIKNAVVKIEGLPEKSFPYEFVGLKPYKTYNIAVCGLGENYQDTQSLSVEATKIGTEVIINVASVPKVVLLEGERVFEDSENNGGLSSAVIKLRIMNGNIIEKLSKAEVKVENIPDGLIYDIHQDNDREFSVLLSGKAINNNAKDSISNLKITILKDKILTAKKDLVSKEIAVMFKDVAVKSVFSEKTIISDNNEKIEKVLCYEQKQRDSGIKIKDEDENKNRQEIIPVGLNYFTKENGKKDFIMDEYINASNNKNGGIETYLPFISPIK